jgi:hypothetical protein
VPIAFDEPVKGEEQTMGMEAILQMVNPTASGSGAGAFVSLRRAMEALALALDQAKQSTDPAASREVLTAATSEAWESLWSGEQALPVWQRPGYAAYRNQVQAVLRDVRNPSTDVSGVGAGSRAERVVSLLNDLDRWEERSRGWESWWRRIKTAAFVGAGVFGTLAYFLMRAVGDVEVDAVTMLCPAAAPDDNSSGSVSRAEFLRNYSAYYFGKPNAATPSFRQGVAGRGAASPLWGPPAHGGKPEPTDAERSLQSALTPTQHIYDWLAQGDPTGRFVFAARLVNRSSRGARFVKSLTTRVTLVESIDIPWKELDVTPSIDCQLDLGLQRIVVQNHLGPPALKVKWKLRNGATELTPGGGWPVVLSTGKEIVPLSNQPRFSLMELLPANKEQTGERIQSWHRRSRRLPSRPTVGEESVAPGELEARFGNSRYWAMDILSSDGSGAFEKAYYDSPRTKMELEEFCHLVQQLTVVVDFEDIRGQQHSREFSLELPRNWVFAIPKDEREEWWSGGVAPAAIAYAAAAAPYAPQILAAAKDTAEPPTNRQEQPFLLAAMDWSGASLVPGASVEHRSEFNTYLSAEGVLLLAGSLSNAPPGRYQLEIRSENEPMATREFVVLPLIRFLQEDEPRFVSQQELEAKSAAQSFRKAVDGFRRQCGQGPTDAQIEDSPVFANPVIPSSMPLSVPAVPGILDPSPSGAVPVGPAPLPRKPQPPARPAPAAPEPAA